MMDVEEKLRQAKYQFASHAVDKQRFVESFWAKVDQLDKAPRVRQTRWKLATASIAAIVLIGGVAISPGIANAAQNIPLVRVVLNWVKGTNVAPYVRSVQQSSTDHGITMTITDVLYGPSQLSFGYVVTPGQSGFPHGGAVTLGSRNGMEFYVNGEQVQLQGIGHDEGIAHGFEGLVTLTDAGTATELPSNFNLQIVLHKIGNQRGTWTFNVPVSRSNMTPVRSFLPMVTKQIGEETITVKEVRFYPTGGMIHYDVTVPIGSKPSLNLNLYNEDRNILDTVLAGPETAKSHVTHGGFATWSYAQSFRVPGKSPTSLIVGASVPPSGASELMPLAGPFPVTVMNGALGKLTITGADMKESTVTVQYELTSNPHQPGFGFSIADITHPNARFVGTLGEKVGPSGSNTYVNVYRFSRNVSSDQLVLRLPPHTLNRVFDVPLRNVAK